MNFYETYESNDDELITNMTDWLLGLIENGDVITFFEMLAVEKNNIKVWETYLEDREAEKKAENKPKEEDDLENYVLNAVLKAFHANRTEKLPHDEEKLLELRANKAKEILNVISSNSEIVSSLAQKIGEMDYDPDNDDSRLLVVLSLIKIIDEFSR